MINLITNIFNQVYKERKYKNPDEVPPNNITPKFIERVEDLLQLNDDARFTLVCLASSNTSLIFIWRKIKYYVSFNYDSNEFEIEYS